MKSRYLYNIFFIEAIVRLSLAKKELFLELRGILYAYVLKAISITVVKVSIDA